MDIPFLGGTFTWPNNREQSPWSRIDKFLVSPDWEDQFPDLVQKRLLRLCSDHFLILLDGCDI
jgi:endonuclease/exonuclease/phosphatase family metal-dependent hydrolase